MSAPDNSDQNPAASKKSDIDSESFLQVGKPELSNLNSTKDHTSDLESKWQYYKQVLAVGVGWMFLFMAVITLRNIQSSINHFHNIGLISMGSFYGGMMMGSFLSSAIVQTLGPKLTLVISTIFHIVFIAVNVFPNLLLLAIVGFVAGISHSSLWAAQSTFLTVLAKSFSRKYHVAYDSILARFFGISFLFSEMSMVFGNPLATLLLNLEKMLKDPLKNANISEHLHTVLLVNTTRYNGYNYLADEVLPYDNGSDSMICGHHFCHSQEATEARLFITDWTRYVVVGAYSLSAVVALLVFLIIIEDKAIYNKRPGWSDLPDKILETIRCICSVKMILFIPMTLFFGLQMAFVSGDVVKAYVSCPVGIPHVGKVMVFYGILDAFSSLLAGWVKKYIGSCVMFTSIVGLNSVLFIALLVWAPDEGVWSYLLFAGFGCNQGFTNVHINSQYGTLFRDSAESAFSVYRLFLGLGLSFGFMYSPYFCMSTKIFVSLALFCVSTVCYYALEIVNKRYTDKQLTSEGSDLEIRSVQEL